MAFAYPRRLAGGLLLRSLWILGTANVTTGSARVGDTRRLASTFEAYLS